MRATSSKRSPPARARTPCERAADPQPPETTEANNMMSYAPTLRARGARQPLTPPITQRAAAPAAASAVLDRTASSFQTIAQKHVITWGSEGAPYGPALNWNVAARYLDWAMTGTGDSQALSAAGIK